MIDHGVLCLKFQHLRELKPKDQKFKPESLESSPKEKFSPLIPQFGSSMALVSLFHM